MAIRVAAGMVRPRMTPILLLPSSLSPTLTRYAWISRRGRATRSPLGEAWCGRWDSNPHDVAIEGF
jgi:hypothetical protein